MPLILLLLVSAAFTLSMSAYFFWEAWDTVTFLLGWWATSGDLPTRRDLGSLALELAIAVSLLVCSFYTVAKVLKL